MNGLSQFLNDIVNAVAGIPFDILLLGDACAFGGIFLLALILCACSVKFRYADKRPFFHLLNAFSAVTLALFCTAYSAPQSIAAAAVFWCVGYLLYGLLCALSRSAKERPVYAERPLSLPPARPPISSAANSQIPAARNIVRLDHALAIADKLLLKSLGRGDRQELEKIKTSLTVLKVKGELSPQDGEALNEMFNAILKLMAKYEV